MKGSIADNRGKINILEEKTAAEKRDNRRKNWKTFHQQWNASTWHAGSAEYAQEKGHDDLIQFLKDTFEVYHKCYSQKRK